MTNLSSRRGVQPNSLTYNTLSSFWKHTNFVDYTDIVRKSTQCKIGNIAIEVDTSAINKLIFHKTTSGVIS